MVHRIHIDRDDVGPFRILLQYEDVQDERKVVHEFHRAGEGVPGRILRTIVSRGIHDLHPDRIIARGYGGGDGVVHDNGPVIQPSQHLLAHRSIDPVSSAGHVVNEGGEIGIDVIIIMCLDIDGERRIPHQDGLIRPCVRDDRFVVHRGPGQGTVHEIGSSVTVDELEPDRGGTPEVLCRSEREVIIVRFEVDLDDNVHVIIHYLPIEIDAGVLFIAFVLGKVQGQRIVLVVLGLRDEIPCHNHHRRVVHHPDNGFVEEPGRVLPFGVRSPGPEGVVAQGCRVGGQER